MSHAVKCPVCEGKGKVKDRKGVMRTCHGCNGKGWITIDDNYVPHPYPIPEPSPYPNPWREIPAWKRYWTSPPVRLKDKNWTKECRDNWSGWY